MRLLIIRSSFWKISVRCVPALASLSALRSASPSWLLMFGSRSAKLAHKCSRYGLGVAQCHLAGPPNGADLKIGSPPSGGGG